MQNNSETSETFCINCFHLDSYVHWQHCILLEILQSVFTEWLLPLHEVAMVSYFQIMLS